MRSRGSGAQGFPLWDAVEPRFSVREPALGTAALAAEGPPPHTSPGFPGPCHGLASRSVRAASPCPAVSGSCCPRLGPVPGSLRAQGSASAIGAGSTVVIDHSPGGPLRETTIWGVPSSHPHSDTRPVGRSGQGGPGGGWEEGRAVMRVLGKHSRPALSRGFRETSLRRRRTVRQGLQRSGSQVTWLSWVSLTILWVRSGFDCSLGLSFSSCSEEVGPMEDAPALGHARVRCACFQAWAAPPLPHSAAWARTEPRPREGADSPQVTQPVRMGGRASGPGTA